ncbi:MAG TPA: histidine kinase, partial [Ferruginibacter sp.]|nr:histidine kinase [Ferruginibacter sp.]
LQYTEGVGHSYASIAASYQLMKRYDSAIYYFKKATSYFHDNGIKEDYYSSLLNVYFYLGDYPGAMETISEEMKLAEQTNDKIRVAHCNNILGYIYFKQENFPESEKYYNAYADNAIELKDTLLIAHALGEISDVYTEEKDYKRAINSLQTVISYSKQMLADTSIKRTYIAWAPQYIAKANFRLGRAYKLSGNLDSALYYSLGSLHTGTHNPGYDTAAFYINAGDVYRLMKKYPEAIFYLHHGYSLSREMNHRENTRDAAQYLSQTYAALNRYDSAFYYFQIFAGLKDSIVNNETKMKIAGIQGQYDIAKKNKEIARQQQIRNILIGSFLFFIIVLLLLYNRSRLVQKNRRQQEYSRQQNELFNAIVSTQDQERKRIAQDIHDSLGSVLSAAKLKLSSLEDSKRPLAPDQLEKYHSTLALLDDAVAELRSISHNIMPATLSKLGLVAALQNLIGKMSGRSAVQVSFTTHGLDERLEENTEISVYRIILELINNIVKHADAKKVSIQLIKYPKYINLIVEDNGKGFDHNKAMEEKRGIGLGNILSRVEFLKGNIDIDSSLGKGTTVIIDIPY